MPNQYSIKTKAYQSGIDWLTLSAPMDKGRLSRFHEAMHDLHETVEREGGKPGRFGMSGYEGDKIDGISFGVRSFDNHAVIAVHGAQADFVARWAIESELDAICRRIDPAMVVEFEKPVPFYGEYLRRRIRAHEKKTGRATRTPFTLFEKSKQDTGAYLGSRSGAVFPRIYDNDLYHHKKSTHIRWKHELETKGNAALSAWAQVKVSEDIPKLCASMVTTRLKQHGICPPGLPDLEPVPLVGTKPPSDFEVWLVWFKRSACNRANAERLDGHAEEIRAALIETGLLRPNGCFAMPTPDLPLFEEEEEG
jgi:hypothetical protein